MIDEIVRAVFSVVLFSMLLGVTLIVWLFFVMLVKAISHLSEQLDRFLALPPTCGQTLNLDAVRKFPLVFWGASDLGREAVRMTKGLVEVAAFTDSDPCKWGTTFEGLPVLSPYEAKTRYKQSTFVVTVYNGLAVRRRYENHGGGFHFVGFSKFILNFPECLPFVLLDRSEKLLAESNEIRRASSIWSDGHSAEEYVYQIGHRLNACEVPTPKLRASDLYFPLDIVRLHGRESFVDCGAYDGDTLKEFLRRTEGEFESYLAIEPDMKNGTELVAFGVRLPKEIQNKIKCSGNALSDSTKWARFRQSGDVVSRLDENGTTNVECCTLDSLIGDSSCTFLKMDIEGAELDALRGAEQTIRRCQPILAISLYHVQNHLWTIPLWVHDLGLNYRLYLRRHGDDCWESVLYAIPEGR